MFNFRTLSHLSTLAKVAGMSNSGLAPGALMGDMVEIGQVLSAAKTLIAATDQENMQGLGKYLEAMQGGKDPKDREVPPRPEVPPKAQPSAKPPRMKP
jgi:hypothetical protein